MPLHLWRQFSKVREKTATLRIRTETVIVSIGTIKIGFRCAHQCWSMKEDGVVVSFLVAGLSLAIIGSLSLAAVDLYFYDENKASGYQPYSLYTKPLQCVLACGIFAALRAFVSIGAVVVLSIGWLLKPIVPPVVSAVSAGLFLGELISGSMFVSMMRYGDGGPYRPRSEMNYLEDEKFADWVNNFTDIQAMYSSEENEEWGPEGEKWSQFRPESYALLSSSYFWNSTEAEWKRESIPSTVLPCIINYNVSKDITSLNNLYDCDRLDLVVVECIGGWTEKRLNSEVKKKCRERNGQQFRTWDRNKLTNWDRTLEGEKYSYKDYVKYSVTGVSSCSHLTLILIVLEAGSCILTLIGVFISFFGTDNSKFMTSSESGSQMTASFTDDEGARSPPQYERPAEESAPAEPVKREEEQPPVAPEQQESSGVKESEGSESSHSGSGSA